MDKFKVNFIVYMHNIYIFIIIDKRIQEQDFRVVNPKVVIGWVRWY